MSNLNAGLPPMGSAQGGADRAKHNESMNNTKSAKYAMKSKSPRNKVGSLQLLLRGKSQNRIDSRGQQ